MVCMCVHKGDRKRKKDNKNRENLMSWYCRWVYVFFGAEWEIGNAIKITIQMANFFGDLVTSSEYYHRNGGNERE